jgi:hypothetical protein
LTAATPVDRLAAMVMPVLPAWGLAILAGVAFSCLASHFFSTPG